MGGHKYLAPFHDDRARDHGLDDRVDRLAEVLQDDGQPLGHRVLHALEVVLLRHLHDDHAIVCLALPQPIDALQLGVDEQRPARAVVEDGAVLD